MADLAHRRWDKWRTGAFGILALNLAFAAMWLASAALFWRAAQVN